MQSAVPSSSRSASPDLAAELVAQFPVLAAINDRDTVALRMADTAACALGAEMLIRSTDNAVGRAARFARQHGVGAEATVWATGETSTVEAAAFRNAVSARYLDYNDTYVGKAIIHPSDMIPALVALAESRGIGWPRLIEAVSVAYEVLCRAAEQTTLSAKGWDASSLTPLGTACGGAWLIGLGARESENALKLAVLDSATLRCIRQGRLSDWKAVASARGAIKGLFAVSMAELGTEAPPSAFENKDGFLERVSGALSFAPDGQARLPDTVLKQYPSQIFTQAMVDMAREIAGKWEAATPPLASVTVRTFKRAVEMVGGHDIGHPLNRETADHSAPFCVAAMLTHRRLGYREFGEFVTDDAVLALMSKVKVVELDSSPGPNTQTSELEVQLADGRLLSARRYAPPTMNATVLTEKLDDLWPDSRPRAWPWACPGNAPAFPAPRAAVDLEPT